MARLSAIRKEAQRKRKLARERFKVAKGAASWYEKQLRQVGKQIGTIVEGFAPQGVLKDMPGLREALRKYAELLTPWAKSVAKRMIAEADQRDQRKWQQAATEIGQTLRRELQTTPIGATYEALMQSQVMLITSLPLDAAERVHRLTLQAAVESRRAAEVAAEIYRSGHVSTSRAMLIARTEVARTASVLCESRARYVGSEGYIWRTSGDSDVRDLHRKLEGKFIPWNDPPVAGENGERAHAGQIYNCFSEDTRIDLSSGVRRVWRVPYDGEVVHIKVAGKLITATPNHPILTDRGWRGAGTIKRGDNIVCMRPQEINIVGYDKHHMYPSFKEVFDASITSLRQVPAEAFKSNFHGDTFTNDNVDEVTIDLLLALDSESVSLKEFRKFILTWSYGRVSGNERLEITESCLPGITRELNVVLLSASLCQDAVSFQLRTQGDSITSDQILDSLGRALVAFCQSRGACPPDIFSDDQILRQVGPSIMSSRNYPPDFNSTLPEEFAEGVRCAANSRRSSFNVGPICYHLSSTEEVIFGNLSGHIYTLESYNGWFGVTSAGIISKNCRCYPEPVLPDIIE